MPLWTYWNPLTISIASGFIFLDKICTVCAFSLQRNFTRCVYGAERNKHERYVVSSRRLAVPSQN